MRVPNLVPIGPQAATCIRPEGYTHTQTDTHTLSYIDIDITYSAFCFCYVCRETKQLNDAIHIHNSQLASSLSSSTVCGVVLECGCEYYGSSVDAAGGRGSVALRGKHVE